MTFRAFLTLCIAAALGVAARPASAQTVDVDFDVALIIVDDYLASGPGLRHVDNDGNGIFEDDQLGMLSVILKGGAGVSCLNPAVVSAIQAGYQHNLTATRSELTVTVGSQGTVDLLSRLQQTDPQLGAALQSALAGMLTIADTGTLAFINQLADLAVVQVLSNTPESGSIGSVQNQINFTAQEYKTFGNAPTEPNYLGPAGDIDGDGQTNLQEYFDGITQKTREQWLVDNCLPAPLRVVNLTGGGLRVTGVPETFSATTAGGVAAPTFQWRKGTTSNFTVISNNASHTIPFLTTASSGNYFCVITDGVTTRQTPIRNLNVVFVPLFFALHPLGASKAVGASHTFSVRVQGGAGPGPYQYTWRRNGVVVGPNAPDFTLTGITVADAGNYTCTVTSNGGPDAKVSNTATLNVLAGAFTLAAQPGNVDAYVGDNIGLTVTPSGGSGVFAYEWRRGGNLFGAPNAATLAFPSLAPADAGTYTCTVRDTFTNAELITDPAVLRVRGPLALTAQPASIEVYVGDLVQFSVGATGGYTPLAYQWRWNNLPIQGQNSPNYASVATLQFPGNYSCLVTDANGASVLSATATLAVHPRLVIQNQPQGGNFYVGENHALIVNATGGKGTLAYQWFRDGAPVPGANTLALAFGALAEADSGVYRCVVSDTLGTEVETEAATLAVGVLPSIATQPPSADLYVSESHTLGVIVDGGVPPLTYQWRKNGILLPAETGPLFNIASATPAVAGDYQCTVRDARDTTIQSDTATLTVSPRIAITAQPQNATLYAGSPLTLSLTATGGVGQRHYAWYRNGVLLEAPDAPQYAVPQAQPGDSGLYQCVVTDDRVDTAFSNEAAVIVGTPINVLTGTVDAILTEGDTAEFPIVVEGGAGDLSFAWRRNGASAGDGPVLQLGPLTLADGGDYACTVSDALSTVDAGVLLRLTVLPAQAGQVPRVADGLVALYTFDEDGGDTVLDRSGQDPPADLVIANPAATRRLDPAGLAIEAATRLDAPAGAARVNAALRDANAVTLEAWLRPAQTFAFSEARIFALAAGRQQRNLTLSQLLDRYEANLRTTATNAAGVPATTATQPLTTLGISHVILTRTGAGQISLFINTQPAGTAQVGGDTSGWNPGHPLTLANDPDGLAPWLGDLHLVAVYDRPLSAQERVQNYLAGPYPAPPAEEGEGDGATEGEGEGEAEGEGALEGEGQAEGEGEGSQEGEGGAEGEGDPEGAPEGEPEGGDPEGEGEELDLGDAAHSADQNRDGRLNLSELLRVIQFYNSPSIGCDAATEDGFAPNGADKSCAPHASDYNPQDWRISLSELLRAIQIFNSGGYLPCPQGFVTEDGFCPNQP